MFTLGDVADILDGALDTGISIIDTLSKLSDIADEGTINKDKCLERLNINHNYEEKNTPSDQNNNGIINNKDYENINTHLSSAKVIDSDVNIDEEDDNKQLIDSRNIVTTETNLSIVDHEIDTGSGKNQLLSNEIISTGNTDADCPKAGEVSLVFKRNKQTTDTERAVKVNRRSTFVFKESPVKTIDQATAQGIPIIEALGDLCNVADDFLKDYGNQSESDLLANATETTPNKPGTPSTPEDFDLLISAKVSEILSSFEKLDTTVDLLKKKALRDNFSNLDNKDKELRNLFPKEYRGLLTDLDSVSEITDDTNDSLVEQPKDVLTCDVSQNEYKELLIDSDNDKVKAKDTKLLQTLTETSNDIVNNSVSASSLKHTITENDQKSDKPLDEESDDLSIKEKNDSSSEITNVFSITDTNRLSKEKSNLLSSEETNILSGQETDELSRKEKTVSPETILSSLTHVPKRSRRLKSRPGTYTLTTVLDNVPLSQIEIDIENDMEKPKSSPACFFKPHNSLDMKKLNKNLLSSSKGLPELQVFPIDVDFEPLADDSKNNVDSGFNLTRERPGTYVLSSSSSSDNSPNKVLHSSLKNRAGTYTKNTPNNELFIDRNNRNGTYTKNPNSGNDLDRHKRNGTYVKESGSGLNRNDRSGTFTKTERKVFGENNFDRNNRAGTYTKESGSSSTSPFENRTGTYTKKRRTSSQNENLESNDRTCNEKAKETGPRVVTNDKTSNEKSRPCTYVMEFGTSIEPDTNHENSFDRNKRLGTYTKESKPNLTSNENNFDRKNRPGTYVLSKSNSHTSSGSSSSEAVEPIKSKMKADSNFQRRTSTSTDDELHVQSHERSRSLENSPFKTKVKETKFREKRSSSVSDEINVKHDHETSLNKSQSMSNIALAARLSNTHETRLAASQPNLLSVDNTRKISIGNTTFSKLGLLKKAMSVSLTKLTQLHDVHREISLSNNTLTGSGSDGEGDETLKFSKFDFSSSPSPIKIESSKLFSTSSPTEIYSQRKTSQTLRSFDHGHEDKNRTFSHEETISSVHDVISFKNGVRVADDVFSENNDNFLNNEKTVYVINDVMSNINNKDMNTECKNHVQVRKKKGRTSGANTSTYVLSEEQSANDSVKTEEGYKETGLNGDPDDTSTDTKHLSPLKRQSLVDRNNKPFLVHRKSLDNSRKHGPADKTPEEPPITLFYTSTDSSLYRLRKLGSDSDFDTVEPKSSPDYSPHRTRKSSSSCLDKADKKFLGTSPKLHSPKNINRTSSENSSNSSNLTSTTSSNSPEASKKFSGNSPNRTRKSNTGLYSTPASPLHTDFLKRKSKSFNPKNNSVKKTGLQEDVPLSSRLAALRMQLEEKRRQFEEDKKTKLKEWNEERSQALQNAFFVSFDEKENKDPTMEENDETSKLDVKNSHLTINKSLSPREYIRQKQLEKAYTSDTTPSKKPTWFVGFDDGTNDNEETEHDQNNTEDTLRNEFSNGTQNNDPEQFVKIKAFSVDLVEARSSVTTHTENQSLSIASSVTVPSHTKMEFEDNTTPAAEPISRISYKADEKELPTEPVNEYAQKHLQVETEYKMDADQSNVVNLPNGSVSELQNGSSDINLHKTEVAEEHNLVEVKPEVVMQDEKSNVEIPAERPVPFTEERLEVIQQQDAASVNQISEGLATVNLDNIATQATEDTTPVTNVEAEQASPNKVLTTEQASPNQGTTWAFTFGEEVSESPGMTPEQMKKRERFIKNRQKQMEEKRAKREAEMEKKRRKQEEERLRLEKEEQEKQEKLLLKRSQSDQNFTRSHQSFDDDDNTSYNSRQPSATNQRKLSAGLAKTMSPKQVPQQHERRKPATDVIRRVHSASPDLFASAQQQQQQQAEGSEEKRYTEYNGPSAYQKPSGKSNRKIIQNAISHCCLSGAVNRDSKEKCLEAIEKSESHHFLVLFRDPMKFRGVYEYYPENELVTKIYGVGPKNVTSKMTDKFFRYNSGGKAFNALLMKSLSIQCDGMSIKKELWEKKQTPLSSTPKAKTNIRKKVR